MNETAAAPDSAAVSRFWQDASVRANFNPARAYTGMNPTEALEPPAWSFDGTREEATAMAELVTLGLKTATSASLEDYADADEALPTAGALSILCDGEGQPVALLQTTSVDVVAFDDVSVDFASAEGEGSPSLDAWRERNARLRGSDVVCERFKVLVKRTDGVDSVVRAR